MKTVKILLKSLRENKRYAILTLIFIIGEAIIETFIPFVTAKIVSSIQYGEAITEVLKTGALLVAMAGGSLLCGRVAAKTCATASVGYARNLRHDLFTKVQTFSFANIDKFSSTSLVTRITTDVGNIQMSFMMLIRTAIRSPLMLIFSSVMAFVMGGWLGMTFVIIIPLLGFGLFMIGRKAMPAFKSVFKKYDKLNESIEENVRGMRVVKGFAREEYEKEKFGAAAETIRKDFTEAERIVALQNPMMTLSMYINMFVVLLVGSYLAITSGGATIDVAGISSIILYGMQVLMSLMMLSMVYVMINISVASARRICEVFEEKPILTNKEDAVKKVKDGSIEFNGVSFKYKEDAIKYALEEVNLKIESGMTVGVLGGTGAGKSTLVQLIPRLYDVSEGSVKVGGVDVREYDMTTLRDNVAMVLQKNLLFSGTIKDNLKWGNPDATDEEIKQACVLAQADEFVTSFADGYDTFIEQGGTNVSGGQKQRLCIARALLKKPKILIMDDSTSAVDTKTDAYISHSMETYIPETTKIIIAQRVASVEKADMIIVMDGGKIVAVGKHEELMKNNEIYRDIYMQQNRGGAADEE